MSGDHRDLNSTTDYPYDVGKYSRKITTAHAEAQIWFDRGLIWLYGFGLPEAEACFRHALRIDPACLMAAWGLAHALGPHYNFQWSAQPTKMREQIVQQTHEAARLAHKIAAAGNGFTPVELALVKALQARFPQAEIPESTENFGRWNSDYADAMKSVHQQFPGDLDVACLYADAMLNLTPWKLWDVATGKPTEGSRASEAKTVLETALQHSSSSTHPGLLHIYIHLMEMSAEPEKAVPAANQLRDLVPDCGHLRHMSSHIDVLVGSYDLATTSNQVAMAVDEKYVNLNPMNIYLQYCLHNVASLIYAAMMAGSLQAALEGCKRMKELITEPFLRIPEPKMVDLTEFMLTMSPHVLVRFGLWEDILKLELPTDRELYPMTITIINYAKGVAYAAQGNIERAEQQRILFQQSAANVGKEHITFPNKSRDVLEVARAMLDGELEYRKKNFDVAWNSFEQAIVLEDKLMYSEPPGWMLPVRHAMAALLLEQGHTRRAAELYAEDLGLSFDGKAPILPRPRRHPRNPWALQGFHECLTSLGMINEASQVAAQLTQAQKGADTKITASCFCRLTHSKS